MTEHNPNSGQGEGGEDRPEPVEQHQFPDADGSAAADKPPEKGIPRPALPADEEAAWAEIVASYDVAPRDWQPPDEEDEHFVPPEPPPLPEADPTTKFAWIAVLGGPLLLIFTVLLQREMTWWVVVLGVGGFLGGFGTLVARMRDGRDDDDWDDPGRGAVV